MTKVTDLCEEIYDGAERIGVRTAEIEISKRRSRAILSVEVDTHANEVGKGPDDMR